MNATDNIKTLAKRYDVTPSDVREMAEDLGLATAYDPARRTWYIAEDARTIRVFNDDLAAHDFTA